MKSIPIVLLASTLFLATTPVMADDDAQSRAYFETGAKAYEKGDYLNAIRAFDQAYALTKRPGLIFSIAQSYKRQYAVDSNPANPNNDIQGNGGVSVQGAVYIPNQALNIRRPLKDQQYQSGKNRQHSSLTRL